MGAAMTIQPDRLWTRPSTLTDEEREKARRAYEESPSILDAAILAALGSCERTAEQMQGVLRRVRTCSAP